MRRPFEATSAALLAAALLCAGACVPARAQAGGGRQEGAPPFLDRGGAIFNVRAYGAKCDGATNDLTAIRSAIAAAEAAGGGTVFIPPSASGCLVSANSGAELLRITKAVVLEGGGWNSRLVYGSAVPATTDVIRFSPADDTLSNYWLGQSLYHGVRGLNIYPQSGSPGRYVINFDTSASANQYLSRPFVEDCQITAGGPAGNGYAIATLNFAGDFNGSAALTIRHNQIRGGLYLRPVGDQLHVENNAFGGVAPLDIEQYRGAAGMLFSGNVVVNDGGLILRAAWHPVIRDNYFETFNAVGSAGAFVNLAGTAGYHLVSPVLVGNTVAVINGAALDAIRLDYADNSVFDQNTVTASNAGRHHLKITANAASTYIGTFNPLGAGGGVSNSGTYTTYGAVLYAALPGSPSQGGNLSLTGWVATGTGINFQTPVTFARLPADGNGVMRYCSDCTHGSNPCAGGGTGAIAKRLNNQWVCN